ncbi:MAG TPA: bifunctional nuclease domain-containing protein, partial [Ktedonobacteraceae bacterium]|nr:bifunctional nuclease domain-containing protein [Ktedonobacteraceae bacterium]
MKQHRDCYDEQDDASLVASVLLGKREAFDILLQRHSSSVFHLCTRLLGNTFEAQDIAQEAALQAFLGLSRLQEPARFAAWFHAIAANLARSALRRHREQSLQVLSDDTVAQMFWIDAPPTLEEYQIERELHETVTRALQGLSETNRQAVIGFYLQGYSYEELAQLLDVPVSTVKGRLFQGRQRLKTLLRPLAETHSRIVKKQRKEQNMSTTNMVELEIFAVRLLLLTQQHVAILRDPQTERGFAVRLSPTESDALITSFGMRQNKDAWPFLQDLSQRLLETMGAQLQRVTINTLAGQSLYATLTLEQEGQKHEVDARLSEVLALAVRTGTPLFIARSLFDTAATLDLTATAEARSWQELETRGKDMQKQGREERLRLEEDVRGMLAPRGHLRPSRFPERLWAW